jgi:hypothetical protein
MRKTLSVIFSLLLISIPCLSQGNQFKVRYNGGTIETKVKLDSWDNLMTVTSKEIFLKLKDGQEVRIDPKTVHGLSYGRNASRNIKGYAAAAILLSPFMAFGMLKKNKQHFIGITYESEPGVRGAILVQGKNDNYRALLNTLKAVTGKEVETEEKP